MVAVLTCPNCTELVVVFRQHAAGLSRRVIEQGSFTEKRDHIAEIITEFLDPSIFQFPPTDGEEIPEIGEPPSAPIGDSPLRGPISQKELEQFVRVDLNKIDEAQYFRKYFGS
ncbi:MAG: hypothetical protein HUU46_20955 [Candidatus Hydrogenedentes bacterium]|nr:hypothetical protein [Candidatus Hydrogenedentota bacterium]